jgi:hypothetical protein
MQGISTTTGAREADAALAEIVQVKETAERLANDDAPGDADRFRVVAGLVHQLAEQMERVVIAIRPPIPGPAGYPEEEADPAPR